MEVVSFQMLFNGLAVLCSFLFGWILKAIWTGLQDLKESDEKLAEKVGKIEVLVAGNYVKRDELSREFGALGGKLDLLFDKLDKKEDRV